MGKINVVSGHEGYYKREKETYSRSKAYTKEPEPKKWAKWAVLATATILPSIAALFTNVGIVAIPCLVTAMLLLTKLKQMDRWYSVPILIPAAVTWLAGGTYIEMLITMILLSGLALFAQEANTKMWGIDYLTGIYSVNILFYYIAVTLEPLTVTFLLKAVLTTALTVLSVLTLKSLIVDGRIQKWLYN